MKKLLLALIIIVISTACQSSFQAKEVEKAGFLKDYSMLRKGKDGQALLRYVNGRVNFKKFTKIQLLPVTVWETENTENIPEKDAMFLAQYFEAQLRKEIGKVFELTDRSGPDVLTVRVAITEAKKANVLRDTISHVMPVSIVLEGGRYLTKQSYRLVGNAAIEMELIDQNNNRLAAFIDKRYGGKELEGVLYKWDDAQKIFIYWAELFAKKIKEVQTR